MNSFLNPIIVLAAAFTTFNGYAADITLAPKLVQVPGGKIKTFTCPDQQAICPEHAYVERELGIAPFEIATTEVSFEDWDECVRDQGCVDEKSEWAYLNRPIHPPCVEGQVCQHPFDEGWGRGRRPVIHVSWNDTQKYIDWLNKKTGGNYRLPTSAEWEYAALAGAATTFSWGNSIGKNKANCDGCGSQWDNRQTAPVASFRPNRLGLHDMEGNVSEWVSSCFPTRSRGSQTCMVYLYRGGAWSHRAKSIDPRGYNSANADFRAGFLGFRLARTPGKAP